MAIASCNQQLLPAGYLDHEPWIVVEVGENSIRLGRNGEHREVRLCGVELAADSLDEVRSLLKERDNLVRANFVAQDIAEIWIRYDEDWGLLNGLAVYWGFGNPIDDGCPNQLGIDAAGRFPSQSR